MNLIELGRNTFPLWWPGALLFILPLLYFFAIYRKSPVAFRANLARTFVAFLAYSLLCFSVTLAKQFFLETSHLVALALAMLAASCFLVALYFERAKPIMSAAGLMLLVTAASASYGNWFPQVEDGHFREEGDVKLDVYHMTTQQLTDYGEIIIFGGLGKSKVLGAIGKAQCPLCHGFQKGLLSERAPNLFGTLGLSERAKERLKDPRYHFGKPENRDTVQHEAFPGSGTATNVLEYIVESDVCHDCYVVAGFGVRGTHDKETGAPSSVYPPVDLSIDEVIALTTWLYIHSNEQPPSPAEIENAYKKFIPGDKWEAMLLDRERPPHPAPHKELLADGLEPVEEIFERAQCMTCHAIPGIPRFPGTHWFPSTIGPKLSMKTIGPQRLKDKTYRGKATSVREYIIESIIDPSIYVVPNYPDDTHPKIYGQKLTALAVQKMADYLSQLEEGKAPPKIN